MSRYLPELARDALPTVVVDRAGYAWAAIMMAIALLNLIVATTFDFETWRGFATFGAVSIKLVAFAVTYLIIRRMVNRKLDPAPAR